MKVLNAKIKYGKNIRDVLVFDDAENLEKIKDFNFPNIDDNSTVKYDWNISIESDEWFYIVLEGKYIERISNTIEIAKSTASISKIQKWEYNKIFCFYLVDTNNNQAIFTYVSPSYLFKKKGVLLSIWDWWPKIEENIDFVYLPKWKVDLYFDWKGKIFFKNFGEVKNIFSDFADLYREASKEEIKNFLEDLEENDFIDVWEKFDEEKVWERNMKKIALIIDEKKIDFSDKVTRKKFNDYSQTFLWEELNITSDGKFKIDKQKDLTNLLKLLQWHYFLDYLDNTKKMEATSSKQIKNN